MPEVPAPPKWILFLLWPFKGESCYPQIEGDLSEEFQERESEHGVAAARRWYCREVYRNLRSLLWRWVTIPVIILPLLCIAFSNSLWMTIVGSIYNLLPPPSHWSFSWILFAVLLNLSIIGLSLGIICSLILRGHERMIRLVFGAYYLGLLTIIYHFIGIKILDSSQATTALGFWLSYMRPIWTLICICMGSIWVERRHHRRHSAA